MECINCNKNLHEVGVLIPIDAPGEDNRRSMCEKCMKENEPELYKNTVDEIPFMNDLKEITGS